MGGVYNPIQDSVGNRSFSNNVIPGRDRDLG
jgi:hypothetical protein